MSFAFKITSAVEYHRAISELRRKQHLMAKGGNVNTNRLSALREAISAWERRMSLTATQRAILRDMVDGAELWQGRWSGLVKCGKRTIPTAEAAALQEQGLIAYLHSTIVSSTYTLTPAGAAAAGEGAE